MWMRSLRWRLIVLAALRILQLWAIALSMACLIQSPALAQIGERPEPLPPRSAGYLILISTVQEDLGLGSEQIEAAYAAMRNVREKYGFAKKKLDSGEWAELFAKGDNEMLQAIGDVLKPEQMKRLKQIEFQQRVEEDGPRAFLEAAVAKELQLTDEQKKLFASIFNQLLHDIGAAAFKLDRTTVHVPASPNKAMDAETFQQLTQFIYVDVPALRKLAMDAVRKSLNDEQKKKLEALTGKPLVLP